MPEMPTFVAKTCSSDVITILLTMFLCKVIEYFVRRHITEICIVEMFRIDFIVMDAKDRNWRLRLHLHSEHFLTVYH